MPASDVFQGIGTMLDILRYKREGEIHDRKKTAMDRGLKEMDEFNAEGGGGVQLVPRTGAQPIPQGVDTMLGMQPQAQPPAITEAAPASTPAPRAFGQVGALAPTQLPPDGTAPPAQQPPLEALEPNAPEVQGTYAQGYAPGDLLPHIGKSQANMSINLGTGAVTWSKHPTTMDERRVALSEYLGWAVRNKVPIGIAAQNARAGLGITDDDLHAIAGPDFRMMQTRTYNKLRSQGMDPAQAQIQATHDTAYAMGWIPKDTFDELFKADTAPWIAAQTDNARRQAAADEVQLGYAAAAVGAEAGARAAGQAAGLAAVRPLTTGNVTAEEEGKVLPESQLIGTDMPPGSTVGELRRRVGVQDLAPDLATGTAESTNRPKPKQWLRMPPEAREKWQQKLAGTNQLKALYSLADEILMEASNSGLVGRTMEGIDNWMAAQGQNTPMGRKIAAYNELRQAFTPGLARAGGEVGNLSVTDQILAVASTPDFNRLVFPDSRTVDEKRKILFNKIASDIDAIEDAYGPIYAGEAAERTRQMGISARGYREEFESKLSEQDISKLTTMAQQNVDNYTELLGYVDRGDIQSVKKFAPWLQLSGPAKE